VKRFYVDAVPALTSAPAEAGGFFLRADVFKFRVFFDAFSRRVHAATQLAAGGAILAPHGRMECGVREAVRANAIEAFSGNSSRS